MGASDREILDHYADSGNRAKEAVAVFFIAAAALAFVLFAGRLRSLIRRAEQETAMLAAVAWAGGTACAVLLLAGNAVSRATAFAAMDDEFQLDANTRRLFEDAGLTLGDRRQRRARLPPQRCEGDAHRCNAVKRRSFTDAVT